MSNIPTESQVFLDTNVLLYAITEHPRFGLWCDALLDRIQRGEVVGYISVVVLNEFIHKLIIGEIAQKVGLKPDRVVQYLKRHREILGTLEAYEVAAEVQTSYSLVILGVTAETCLLARRLMQVHQLLSNDAFHLAVMQETGIQDLVTNDTDFDGIEGLQVWKPGEST